MGEGKRCSLSEVLKKGEFIFRPLSFCHTGVGLMGDICHTFVEGLLSLDCLKYFLKLCIGQCFWYCSNVVCMVFCIFHTHFNVVYHFK